MSASTPVRLVLAVVACLALGGCISLFPKTKPAQLYRFDGAPVQADAALPAASAPVIQRGAMSFSSAASGDKILTVTGSDTAYIAGARWISPAPVLFEEAMVRAFEASGGPRLAEGGAALRAPTVLNIDVQAFEAHYDQGPNAPPQVVVQVRAVLVRVSDRTVISDRLFTSQQTASENRVGPIVEAYNAAVHDVLTKLVGWAAQAG